MIFNTSISGGGIKFAQGTVTAVYSGSTSSGTDTITVSGLDFTPAHVMLVAQEGSGQSNHITGIYDTLGACASGKRTLLFTPSAGGFEIFYDTKAITNQGAMRGEYNWIAWAE